MAQQLTSFKPVLYKFPINPTTAYNKNLLNPIDELVDGYHNHQWINLEDNIQYNNNQQYLKRCYQKNQIPQKFKLLGQYYRFHFQAPRLFMEGIVRIIENNVDQKRAIQYLIVTKQMNNNQVQNNQFINTHRTIQSHQKLIKDVSLSYQDFQDKPLPKQIIGLRKIKKSSHGNIQMITQKNKQNFELTQRVQKTMNRVDSMHDKKPFFILKPRNQIKKVHENDNKKNNIQIKYKKLKGQKSQKKSNRSKRQKTQRSRVTTSKIPLNHNQGSIINKLSRSKSKTQLHQIIPKKIDGSNNNSTKNSVCQNYKNIKSGSSNSHQNSMVKSVSKKQILGDKKNILHHLYQPNQCLPEKGQHSSNKKIKQKNSDYVSNANYLAGSKNEKGPQSQRSKQYKIQTFNQKTNGIVQQKMFNRALQLKKKKT